MFFSSSARLLLLVELYESPGQAFRRHFGKHEHPVYFSRIRRGAWRRWWWGDGGVFVCPCEREEGGGEKEGWTDRKRAVRGKRRRRCRNAGVGGYCRRKRHKQLINQHRKETGIQTAEQRWRRTDTDRWGQGGRVGFLLLSLHSWLWLAGCRLSVSTTVLSPLPVDILSACLSVWALAGDLGGAGTWTLTSSVWSDYCLTPLLPCNLNSHWSLSVVMFLFFWGWGSQRREGKGQWKETNSPSSSGAPHWQINTPHTPAFDFFYYQSDLTLASKIRDVCLLYKTSYIWSLQRKFWCALFFVSWGLKGFLSDRTHDL